MAAHDVPRRRHRTAADRTAMAVRNGDLASHAERALTTSVSVNALALEFEPSTANSIELRVAGTEFYPRMLDDIALATSSVHVNQYGFRPGAIGDAFADLLIAKARDGVPVRLIVDAHGSDPEGGSRHMYRALADAGVIVHVVHATKLRVIPGPIDRASRARWNLDGLGHFDHRKVLVIDGRIGWVGGAGIEDHFGDGRFHDLFVRVAGPVVSQLQLVYVTSLSWLGGSVPTSELDSLFPTHDVGPDAVPAMVLHNAPGRHRPITSTIADMIDDAAHTLVVTNPYVTDRQMIHHIAAAAARGVDVRLFVPAQPNNWACATAQRFHHGHLLDAGVHILEHPTMLHAKTIVRDDRDVLVGTCNLDAWSLKRFFEINLRVQSRALATQYEERFVKPAETQSRPGRRLRGALPRAKASVFAACSPLL